MRIEIGQFEYTECWDGVLYKKLSDYPNITEWEIQNILDFIKYESDNGRSCDIDAEESIILGQIGMNTESFDEKFISIFGSLKCAELRRTDRSCNDFVGFAAQLTEEIIEA